ncbi:lasso peptide biosynthesis B2 protein [Lysobacter tyrosinilyticus]
MNPAFPFRAWRGIKRAGWRLAFETGYELLRARVVTCLSPDKYLPAPAVPMQPRVTESSAAEIAAEARLIGNTIEAVARRMPFRALCLQQALAARRMLQRRGYPATLSLALSTHHEDRAVPQRGRAAHAWVSIGDTVICGDGDLSRYAVIACFH